MSEAVVGERAGSAPAPVRLEWVDAVRGYSVAAVVLFHVVLWHFGSGAFDVAEPASSGWEFLDDLLGSLRMPVLLAVSGLVMARRVRSGPLRGRTGVRAATNYYLYVVWLVLYAGFYLVVRRPGLPHRVDGWREVLVQLAVPGTTLWYLLALALYTCVLTLVRRWPVWLVLGLLAAVTIGVHAYAPRDVMWPRVLDLAVFFALGVYGAAPLRSLADRVRVWHVLGVAATAAVVTAAGRLVDGPVPSATLFLVRGTALGLFAVVAVAWGCRWVPVRRLGALLGRHTLPVYVLHPWFIALLVVAAAGPANRAVTALLANPVAALAYPVLVTAAIVALSVPACRLAERAHVGWLFRLPEPARLRLETWADRGTRPAAVGAAT